MRPVSPDWSGQVNLSCPTGYVPHSTFTTEKVLVETECGPVQGFTQEKVSYFLGVPYAMPPLRELRWRSPR